MMKKKVLKQDVEFFVALFVMTLLFVVLESNNVQTLFSMFFVSALFLVYIAYSGYQLFNI